MLVALYLRRSTNEALQADSLSTQEELLRAFAAEHGHVVVDVFADSASGRSSRRSQFRQLIERVTAKPRFEAILVRDVSRWGRFDNVDESAYWEFFCLMHDVRVIYVEEIFRSDTTPYATLLKVVKRIQAAEFSRDKSRMVQYAKARVVRGGFYPGGAAPYGMRRVIVKPNGAVVQALAPGEHKAVGNLRIKLAPGTPEEVAIVKRIYAEFLGGTIRNTIARRLNADRVPSPTGKGWKYPEISKILRNPVYAGFAKIRCAPSANFPNGETILTPGSWPEIITEEAWRKANELLDHSLWKRTPPGLAEQLRVAFERQGRFDRKMRAAFDLQSWETYLRTFTEGYRDALVLAHANVIAETRERVLRDLRKLVTFRRDGDAIVIDELLRVGFKASFPRMLRGALHWEFSFTGDEDVDVTIGLGFSPPPTVALLHAFCFHNRRFRPRRRVIRTNLNGRACNGNWKRSVPEIGASLRDNLFRDSRRAKELLQAEIAKHPVLDLPRVARSLGWSPKVAYALYKALLRDGVLSPPLKFAKGKWVTAPCTGCGAARRVTVSYALKLKTTFCQRCWQNTRGGAVDVTCPNCGGVRTAWRSTVARLSAGTATPCAACDGKEWRIRGVATRGANSRRRRAAMLDLVQRARALLEATQPNVRLTIRKGKLAPRLSWLPDTSRTRYTLILSCSQPTALRIDALAPTEKTQLATLLLDRRRWTKVRSQSWRVDVDRTFAALSVEIEPAPVKRVSR